MNNLYTFGRQGFLDGTYNWLTQTYKVMLATTAYQPNVQSDQFVSRIPSVAIVTRSPALTAKTATNGVARAANLTIPQVSGPSSAYLVIYQDTGNDATARLIALLDTGNGLPVTPNGGDISIAWDTGPYGIFQI